MKKRLFPILLLLLCLLVPISSVSVSAASKSVTVTLAKKKKTSKSTLTVGEKLTIKAKSGGKVVKASKLKYSSSNKLVATVSKKGVVTAKSAGTANITITTKDKKKKAAVKVTVKAKATPAPAPTPSPSQDDPFIIYYYELSSISVTVKEGESTTISLLKQPGATKVNASWSSSNTSIATVNNGRITGVKEGYCNVTASYNGRDYSCFVSVETGFDEAEAKAKTSYVIQDSGKGVAVILTNNYSRTENISGTLVYKSASGSMLQSANAYANGVGSGQKAVMWFDAPYDSNYDTVSYASCSLTLTMSKTDFEPAPAGTISVKADVGADNITAQYTNNSRIQLDSLNTFCLFYDASGKLITAKERYAECKQPSSVDFVTYDFPYDDDYKTIKPATYKLYYWGFSYNL